MKKRNLKTLCKVVFDSIILTHLVSSCSLMYIFMYIILYCFNVVLFFFVFLVLEDCISTFFMVDFTLDGKFSFRNINLEVYFTICIKEITHFACKAELVKYLDNT